MNQIDELLLKLPAVIAVGVDCYGKNPMLYPLRESINKMHLAGYWWGIASKDLNNQMVGTEIGGETEEEIKIIVPTMLGAGEQLNYLSKNLGEVTKSTADYLNSVELPPQVKYNVEQGYNKLMEAMFNIDISTKFYEQINTRG